jgi:hypothetical protein
VASNRQKKKNLLLTDLGGVPANVILDENGQSIRDENNQMILAGP